MTTEQLDHLEKLSKELQTYSLESTAINIVRYCRTQSLFDIGSNIGKKLSPLFPFSVALADEYGMCFYYNGKYTESFDVYNKILLTSKGLDERTFHNISFNAHFNIYKPEITDRYISYNKEIVDLILNKPKSPSPRITFSITTCKRYDLFEKTMNSFLNCCEDISLIDEWLCMDDNSSVEDRNKMKVNYPFFTFVYKGNNEKGHSISMNMIVERIKTPYVFHCEDDWKFFVKKPYISECLEVINSSENVGQCLINKNYGETVESRNIIGGKFMTTSSGLRYYIHEYEPNQDKFFSSKGQSGPNCAYWPHFSLRPSLIKRKVFDDIGRFSEAQGHFELEYANRYISRYISTFLDDIYCLHIGRLTSERYDSSKENAYNLNSVKQFEGVNANIKYLVLNLDRRNDRLVSFLKNLRETNPSLIVSRFSAVDGKSLKYNYQIGKLFVNNDYNWRRGIIGCALSHVLMWIELINSDYEAYCIFEDDATLVPDFKNKLLSAYAKKDSLLRGLDLLFFGSHFYDKYITKETFDKEKYPRLKRCSASTSLKASRGGTFGYLITKEGARKLLAFIDKTTFTNAVDTMMQKSADDLEIYYTCPFLASSECFTGETGTDTDIQRDYDSLLTHEERRESDLAFLKDIAHMNISMFKEKYPLDTPSYLDARYGKMVPKDENVFYEKYCISPLKYKKGDYTLKLFL